MNLQQKKQAHAALALAVELAGSGHKFAKICKVSPQRAHNWLYRDKHSYLPAEFVLTVEEALKGQITRYQLRPDIYPLPEFNKETLRKP